MKKVFKLLVVSFILFLASSVFLVTITDAKPCYKDATGGFVDIGGTPVFVCPGAGNTACLYLSDCPEQ